MKNAKTVVMIHDMIRGDNRLRQKGRTVKTSSRSDRRAACRYGLPLPSHGLSFETAQESA